MGVYDKASLVQIPSGYKSGTLYSVLPANGNGDFTHTRASSATRVNKDGLIESVASGVPRLDYPLIDGVVQDCPALLLEPSRTNSLPYSNEFTNAAWSKLGAGTGSTPVVTANYGISPDGSQNADRLQLDKGSGTTTSDYSFLYDTVSSVGTGSISIWMKSNDSNTYQVALRVSNYVVCEVTPNWQRFELNNQASTSEIQVMLRGTYGTSDSADILIYGAQLEAGSYATSYIPTSGSTVTRSADECNGAGTSAEFNDSEGVLFAELEAFEDGGTTRYVGLTDGGGSPYTNSVAIQYRNDGNLRVFHNGLDFVDAICIVGIDQTVNHKIAVRYKQNDMAVYIDGVTQSLNGSFVYQTISGLNELTFAQPSFAYINPFYGKSRQVMVFNEGLIDSELEQITSWTSFSEMAKGQLYTIE